MNTAAVTALLAGKEPVRVLVLASEKEVAELADLGLPVNTVDGSLSMQHLASAKLASERMLGKAGRLQVMTVTREEPQATEAERALIYAMLVRCRKVISCRDKLEDMLKFLIPNYVKEGKYQLVIAIGCTGGQHRSVTLANALYERMKDKGNYGIKLFHRELRE